MDRAQIILCNCSYPACAASGRFMVLMGGTDLLKRCGGCREVVYCGKECQRGDWPAHKSRCKMAMNMRLVHELLQKDAGLRGTFKRMAVEKSNAPEVGLRRAVGYEFKDAASLALYVERRGRGAASAVVHHFSEAYCVEWKERGDQRRGHEDVLASETITLGLVRTYNPETEGVFVTFIQEEDGLLMRTSKLAF